MAKTPLYDQHVALGGRLVSFFGWELPLHYGSQVEEHHAVRKDAGVFDVSHMTIIDVLGAGGRQFLRYLLANDIDQITIGQALYGCMLNKHGGIMDDLIVYHRSPDNYRLVLNAATHDKVLSWIQQMAQGFAVGLLLQTDLAILAIQGPKAIAKTMQVVSPGQMDAIATLRPFHAIEMEGLFIARTGYTGEDGLEIIVPKAQANALWQALLGQGIKPCGLGARDTLRLEAGLMLYGQDMDETKSPYESALGWTVKYDGDRDFIGRGALLAQKQYGVQEKIVGLVLEAKGVLRPGQKVVNEGLRDGFITSGGFSPTLGQSIAFARVPLAITDQCLVDIRGKLLPAKVTAPRFVKKGKALV